jgi:IclR family transcriptional regulator, acetate operon repressor
MRKNNLKAAPVGVIGKVLRILELLDQFPSGLALKDISEKTSMNKSTVHRFLSHLESEAYLFRGGAGTYMLGPRLVRLGSGVNLQATLCNVARPTLEKLRKSTDETVNLAILDGTTILYLNVLESLHTFRLVSPVGTRRPLHCTSLGKAILANMEDEPRKEHILSSLDFTPNTARTLTTLARFRKDLLQTRRQGFSLDDEEAEAGARCVGAAIHGSDGKVLASISVSGPVSRVSRERLPFFAREIGKAARDISWQLGYRAPKADPLILPRSVVALKAKRRAH